MPKNRHSPTDDHHLVIGGAVPVFGHGAAASFQPPPLPLQPVLPEVREYVMRMVTELVTNYDFDGYILDYCRYMNMNSDFSEASKKAFEEYAGVTCTDFPRDIYYYADGVTDKTQFTPTDYNILKV